MSDLDVKAFSNRKLIAASRHLRAVLREAEADDDGELIHELLTLMREVAAEMDRRQDRALMKQCGIVPPVGLE